MGIRFYCPECGRRMNVKSFLAGKRGICPHCDARWEIPLGSEIPEGAPKMRPSTEPAENEVQANSSAAAEKIAVTAAPSPVVGSSPSPGSPAQAAPDPIDAVPDPIDAAPDAVWYVRPASGGEFGPARGDVMRRWVEEGRVGPDSMVWCEGWAQWQIAGPVFPALASPQPQLPDPAPAEISSATKPKTLAGLETIQKKNLESNGRAARKRSAGSGKSIAAIVALALMIVALFVVLIVVVGRS